MTTTYYARVEYIYTTGDRIFTIPFSYIKKEHITVLINDEETTNFVFNSESQLQINDTLTAGDKVVIARTTPIDERLVVFTNTSILSKENQNLSAQQTFDAVQEIYDNNIIFEDTTNTKVDNAVETANSALTTANTAISTANSATTTANTALSNSQTAVQTANSAEATAALAEQEAAQALTTANNAETIAERAEDKVDEFGEDIEAVKEAAEKINELEEAVNTAVTKAGEATAAAQSASSDAEVATSKASEATTAAQVATAQAEEAKAKVGDLSSLTTTAKNTVVAAINEVNENKADTSLSNLSATGQGILDSKLNNSQISNCILKDPQNIKLELNNGTLTLKAGSVICVPNDFESDGVTPKFDEVTIANDLSKTQTSNGTMTVFVNTTGTGISIFASSSDGSGSTPPQTGSYDFYNTTENKLFRYSNGVAGNQYAFPIAKITISNGAISSIDEVYQSIGYIGSTAFVRKGLRGLTPNGRNADGSLKNVEIITNKVLTRTFTSALNNTTLSVIQDLSGLTYYTGYYYDNINNYNMTSTGVKHALPLANLNCDSNGVISGFKPKTAFHAVDYSNVDGQWVSNVIHIIDSSTTLAGQTTKTYSLSSYLPNDGNIYEVLFTCNGNTGTTSGDYADIAIGSDIIETNNNRVASATTKSASHVRWAGCGIIPISTSRNIYIRQIGPSNCTCLYFRCVGYRRIGTNN